MNYHQKTVDELGKSRQAERRPVKGTKAVKTEKPEPNNRLRFNSCRATVLFRHYNSVDHMNNTIGSFKVGSCNNSFTPTFICKKNTSPPE